MKLDNESWVIEVGDDVINKKAAFGYANLADLEKAIYCLWVIDYSIRNSGTLMEIELFPPALEELAFIANAEELIQISFWLKNPINEVAFCEQYYGQFDIVCGALRLQYESAPK